MNNNRESQPAVTPVTAGLPAIIANSAVATLGMALTAVGLLIAVPGANAAPTVSTSDQDFILAAAQGGMTEVKMGELASQQGMRGDVKTFGQRMVKDHTAINDDLKALIAAAPADSVMVAAVTLCAGPWKRRSRVAAKPMPMLCARRWPIADMVEARLICGPSMSA